MTKSILYTVVDNNRVLVRDRDPGKFLVIRMQQVYWNIYENNYTIDSLFCDVNLCCNDGKTVKAHSAVLAVASPFLKNVLKETWTSHCGASISLPDFNSKDIHHLIEFLYTGELSLSSRCDYETFQQLITELEIGLDNRYPITVEEIDIVCTQSQSETRTGDESNCCAVMREIPALIPIEPLDNNLIPMKSSRRVNKPHQCQRCDKTFAMPHLLKNHQRTHTNERPYSCDVCGQAFRNPSNLLGHKKIHSNLRPFSCRKCDKSFYRRFNLAVHQKVHSRRRAGSCNYNLDDARSDQQQ